MVRPALEVPARPLTLGDVTRLARTHDRHRFELSEGNLIVRPPDTWGHQRRRPTASTVASRMSW